jgi:hypothetical protein
MKIKKILSGLFVVILVGGVVGIGALGYRHRDDIKDWLNGSSEVSSITSSEDTTSDESSETPINVVVNKTFFEFAESELFDEVENYQTAGPNFWNYRKTIRGVETVFEYPATTDPELTGFAYNYLGYDPHFLVNIDNYGSLSLYVNEIKMSTSNYSLQENRYDFSLPSTFSGAISTQDDQIAVKGLLNKSVYSSDVLEDGGGQYVLDEDGVTKLYLYQV